MFPQHSLKTTFVAMAHLNNCKYLYFTSIITDTTHILSTITQTKLYLSTYCAESFKPPLNEGINIFFSTSENKNKHTSLYHCK